MAQLKEICRWMDERLQVGRFGKDVSNNGLQVQGNPEIRRIIAGVDGCQALFRAAADRDADLVIVHHGISWGSEPRRFAGSVGRQMAMLFGNGISLYAAHLPLDSHPEIGNNALLADLAGAVEKEAFFPLDGNCIGTLARLPEPVSPAELAERFRELPGCEPKVFVPEEGVFDRVSFLSGSGGTWALQDSLAADCRLVVTGEFTHVMYHFARENGIAVIALGHYASETVGIRALLAEVTKEFALDGEFIHIPTGL